MKLSIIVPVYNVAPYLDKCIESILAQSVSDFEIILVDDGSTDASAEICDRWAQNHPCITVVHKENGGLSDARNAGLAIAQGEYVGFVDSDDYICPDMYQKLIMLAEEHNAQICTCSFTKVDGAGNIITCYPELEQDMVYQRHDFIDNYYPRIRWELLLNMCNKLFRRELFQKVRFPKGLIYEDAFVLLDLLDQCSIIVVCHQPLYYYVFRTGSIVNTNFSQKHFSTIDYCFKYYNYFVEKRLPTQAYHAFDDLILHYMQIYFAVNIQHKAFKQTFLPYKKRFYLFARKNWGSPLMCRMKKIIIQLSRFAPMLAYKLTQKYYPEWLYTDMR